jgi:hypothetical protein
MGRERDFIRVIQQRKNLESICDSAGAGFIA